MADVKSLLEHTLKMPADLMAVLARRDEDVC
jgi:hypothetical protein